jgi:outer membrane protein
MPLFTGYAVQNRIKETLSLQEKAEKDLEGYTRTLAQSIRSVFYKLRADQGQVRALEAAELSRQSALDANLLGYQVGVGTNIDVLNSQSQLFQTRRDAARARYDVLVGGLRLRQAAGVLAPADLQPINEQLVKP